MFYYELFVFWRKLILLVLKLISYAQTIQNISVGPQLLDKFLLSNLVCVITMLFVPKHKQNSKTCRSKKILIKDSFFFSFCFFPKKILNASDFAIRRRKNSLGTFCFQNKFGVPLTNCKKDCRLKLKDFAPQLNTRKCH